MLVLTCSSLWFDDELLGSGALNQLSVLEFEPVPRRCLN